MLFNSIVFIYLFLPVIGLVYFFLNKNKYIYAGKIFLILASLFFYGYWNYKYVPLIILSIIINFTLGTMMNVKTGKINKYILGFGILINLVVLGYYKYADFFIETVNVVLKTHFDLLHIALPLAISFFTFQQISYLADSYNKKTCELDFLNYTLFVTFFPQLIAGPIMRHSELMPQFAALRTKVFNIKSFSEGLFLFIIGLSKKVIIADTVAQWANAGYANSSGLPFIDAWVTVLSYTFQIYYDFSGYTDMAMGIGKMFNINLVQNFNNPYQALSIEDFWRRWHISLSRFLKDYLYIPLQNLFGKASMFNRYLCILIVFFVSGLWHGASWLFVMWGISHGLVNIFNKILRHKNININSGFAWIMTFLYLNLTWVLFRSENLTTAKNILLAAFGKNGLGHFKLTIVNNQWYLLVLPILIVCIFFPIFNYLKKRFKPNLLYSTITVALFLISLVIMLTPNLESPFIYFNF